MTREEAVNKLIDAQVVGQMKAGDFLNGLAALGILKLEEPKDAMQKFIHAMESQGYQRQSICVRDAITAIKLAKIKFVDE